MYRLIVILAAFATLTVTIAIGVTAERPGSIRFEDVTARSGVSFITDSSPTPNKNQPETMISGVGLIDYDNDGYLDIFLINGAAIPSLKKESPKYYNRLLEVNAEERWVRVEPGIVLDELNAQLAPLGLRFAPDISTLPSRRTMGASSFPSRQRLNALPSVFCVEKIWKRLELVPLLSVMCVIELARIGTLSRCFDFDKADKGIVDGDRIIRTCFQIGKSRFADQLDRTGRKACEVSQVSHKPVKRSAKLIFRRTVDRDAR